MRVNIVISGYGTVGKEFVRLVFEKALYVNEMYGIELVLTGVIGSAVNLFSAQGLHIKELLTYGTGSDALEKYLKNYPLDKSEKMPFGHVLIESTPTNLQTGEPGRRYIETAIENHMDVVAISKGALVSAWKEIKQKATQAKVRIRYSGATAAALPTLDIGQFSLAGCQIESIEGILNGTTNYIITKMYEEDVTFQEALHQAQRKGIAETNPSLDVSGMDSACKLLLLANSLFQSEYSLDHVSVKGIEGVTKQDIEKAKAQGKSLKLIGTAYKDYLGNLKLEVYPREIEKEHPLAYVNGTEKGITFHTDIMGKVTSTGGASSPRGAAAAALKDLINLYRKDV
ncbi:homoserine dehydrogenase [Bacillus sp. Xin]|uniref:homoserine dehydrogenase n=1 Tax=unclassified Bacillus (in: firmicutes) TaxID=185979 RepID=UPI0015717020|nr:MULTISPECIES: homoserine dehydrogenase [unclassified Bacillus (in: firmicutes)]MBC6973335.1 homoserine dehydrogenase [Bacillus sp. Xin]NSW35662.1 homoserine dehydrogenase [Bacillus sp. Xin1]